MASPDPGYPAIRLGAILVGGASRRMGTTKALVDLGGSPMVAVVAAALRRAGASQVALIGGDPEWVAERAGLSSLVVVPDDRPGCGPLTGLGTALSWARTMPGADGIVWVAACDQPDIDSATFSELAARLEEEPPSVMACVVRTPDGARHPFPSAWRSRAAEAIAALVESDERRAMAALDVVSVIELDVDLEEAAQLVDLDTPADLAHWIELH